MVQDADEGIEGKQMRCLEDGSELVRDKNLFWRFVSWLFKEQAWVCPTCNARFSVKGENK